MNESGALLVVAGVWVLAQVFAGNALGRLGIVGSPDKVSKGGTAPATPGSSGQSGLAPSAGSGTGSGGGGGGSW